ncbi:MAG TPA: zinc-binding alcohol dehydrogenase [Microbacterium sp.]|uniref:zinc-binding alcohol dehydrogenase n=1 Tax=Microbacterium sp. TaxID=51671 RepID=UPI002B465067|nr:zinc-binding alcohol dehydrogenase [Microbacterium sp.]HKT56735.1 zinc-binding alcohol dehydrogenase [Microbacterium sp.]
MTGAAQWTIREDSSTAVLVALYLRQVLGIRSPEELPHLRGIPPRHDTADATPAVERQWREYWELTVEPTAHPSPVPLDLVDGFDMLVVLPVEGFDDLRAAIAPYADDAVAYAESAHKRYAHTPGVSYRAYAGAIAEYEREVGRRAHAFELNVQVLPLVQRGVWWIGALTIAVTDGLRQDIVMFDAAIQPIIAELA